MRQLIGTVSMRGRGGHRRGREGRSPDALQRRGGRQRRRPALRRRGRPDRRHHADGQGHAERARGAGGRRARRDVRPVRGVLHGEAGRRPGGGGRGRPRPRRSRRTSAGSRRRRTAASATSRSASWTGRGTSSSSRRCATPARGSGSSPTATWRARSPPPGRPPASTCCSASAAPRRASSRPCAMKCIGGELQGRLWPKDDAEREKAIAAGHDLDRVLPTDDLVQRRQRLLLRHRRHRRRPAARRALPRGRRDDAVDRDAVEVRHGPDDRRLPPADQAAIVLLGQLRRSPRRRPDGLDVVPAAVRDEASRRLLAALVLAVGTGFRRASRSSSAGWRPPGVPVRRLAALVLREATSAVAR